MLHVKRRPFSRRFSKSFSGDLISSSQPSPEVNTPASASSDSPPGTSKTDPVVGGDTESKPAPSTPKTFVDKMVAKVDILKANHDERVLVVGRGVVLTANVTSCEKVVVEGQFQGNIKTTTFILSEGGHMEGEVRCCDGCVGGSMRATIIASKTLIIGSAAVVTGDMVYDSLQVIEGGRLQGKLAHYSTIGSTEGNVEKAPPDTDTIKQVEA